MYKIKLVLTKTVGDPFGVLRVERDLPSGDIDPIAVKHFHAVVFVERQMSARAKGNH